jgi:DNA-binding MarR family transcriptional regulator
MMELWSNRFLSSTRGQVVQLLRRGEATVNELAEALNLTDNAVRSHLSTLERDGLVRQSGKRTATRKPEVLFSLTPEAGQLFPKAYDLLLNQLLHLLESRITQVEKGKLLRDVGLRLAGVRAPLPTVSREAELRKRLKNATRCLPGWICFLYSPNRLPGLRCSDVARKFPRSAPPTREIFLSRKELRLNPIPTSGGSKNRPGASRSGLPAVQPG